jgi:hypothetical protein
LWVDVRVGVLLPAGGAIDRLSLSTGRVKVFMAVEYWYHVAVIVKVASVSNVALDSHRPVWVVMRTFSFHILAGRN